MRRPNLHRRVFLVTLAALALAAPGCAGAAAPEPTPTPTALFASEEEAFAAAEETYRAYIDALNDVDYSDPTSIEPLLAWTTGELRQIDQASFSESTQSGLRKSGNAIVMEVIPLGIDPPNWAIVEPKQGVTVQAIACLNVTDVALTDTDGNSMVTPDRADVQILEIGLSNADSSPTGLLVSGIGPADPGVAC